MGAVQVATIASGDPIVAAVLVAASFGFAIGRWGAIWLAMAWPLAYWNAPIEADSKQVAVLGLIVLSAAIAAGVGARKIARAVSTRADAGE